MFEVFTFKENPGFSLRIKAGVPVPRRLWPTFRKSNAQLARAARSAAWSELEPTKAPEYVSDATWARRLRGRILSSYNQPIPMPCAKCPECSEAPEASGHLYGYCCGMFYDSKTGTPLTTKGADA